MAAAWLWAVWRIFSLLNTFYCFERENSEEFFIFNVHWIIVKEFTSILDIHSFVKMSSLKLALFPRKEKSLIPGNYLHISSYQNFCQANKPIFLKILLHFFSRLVLWTCFVEWEEALCVHFPFLTNLTSFKCSPR